MVLVGTEETENHLNEQYGGYENVYIAQELEQLDKQIVTDLDSFSPTSVRGDILDGLMVAVDMLGNKCGNKKYIKRIFIITDGAT